MTRVKRIVTTTCAVSFLLGWTGMSNMQLLIPFRSAAAVLLAKQNNPKASYNQGYQLYYAGRSRNDGTYDPHATTECMTGHATKTSTADRAMTNPTAVPAR